MSDSDVPRDFHRRWPTLKPPLRPHASVAAEVDALLPPPDAGPVLLLGVTPELATLARPVIAMDWSAAMIAVAWPGDTAGRRAIEADWKTMPLADGAVAGAMGDGALTMLHWPGEAQRLLGELWRVIRPGGRAVIRCFATPEPAETLDAVDAEAAAGRVSFHEWKMRFNMAAAAAQADPNITSAALYAHYQARWPDRQDHVDAPGWPGEAINEIEEYRDSDYLHCYPSRSSVARLLETAWPGPWCWRETEGYPGAAYCPLLVLERA